MVSGSSASRRRVHVDGADKRPPPPGTQGDLRQPRRQNPPDPASPPIEPRVFAENLSESGRIHHLNEGERVAIERVQSVAQRFRSLELALPFMRTQSESEHAKRVQQFRSLSKSQQTQLTTEEERSHATASEAARSTLNQIIDDLAPGAASAPWPNLIDAADGSLPARHFRVGQISSGPAQGLPALVPLVDGAGWFVSGDEEQRNAMVLGALTRLVAQCPIKHLSITVFDPRLSGQVGRFVGLRRIRGSSFPTPATDPNEFAMSVERTISQAAVNAELAVSSGVSSLGDLWRNADVPEGTLSVVVVLDYPFGIDERLQQQLVRAAKVGGRTGVSLLVATDEAVTPAAEVHIDDLRSALVDLRVQGGNLTAPQFNAGVSIEIDPRPDDEVISSVVELSAIRSSSVAGPLIPLIELLEADIKSPWKHSAAAGLGVVIGRSGRDPMTLDLRTENPPLPNLLIGGAVGQGKSNLLLSIIYGFATRYSPDELELYLLDFKRGLEFKRFDADSHGEAWLPHTKVLGLESNHAFGVAVLQHVHDEMERRSDLFKSVNAGSIDEYRGTTKALMPRVLLVIDEFHVLFEGDEGYVDTCVELTEALAKQGRAYGIHLLLASQTISGIRGLAVKGDAIFGQFPLRMSLKNTPGESQAILSQGNKAASELTYRGEAILNKNFGGNPELDNIRGTIAFAEPSAMAQLQRDLWTLRHGERPVLFMGNDFAELDPTSLGEHRRLSALQDSADGLSIWLGRPVAVSAEPRVHHMAPDADQAVAIVGADETLARAALLTMIMTACHSLAGGGTLTVLDGNGETGQAWFEQANDYATECGVPVNVLAQQDIAAFLREAVAQRMDSGASGHDLIVGLGLQRVRGMDEEVQGDDGNEDEYVPPGPSGRTALRRLAEEGAIHGMYLIGWWHNLRTLEVDLSYEPGVALFVTADLGRDDLKSIAGPSVSRVDGRPRLGIHDRSGEGLETVVPYADPNASGVPA